MNKKRCCFIIVTLSICSYAFPQHPGSHGGGFFYWLLAGGIGALVNYGIYWLFGKMRSSIKNGKQLQEEQEDVIQKDRTEDYNLSSCIHCGMPILIGQNYCNYCGKKQYTLSAIKQGISGGEEKGKDGPDADRQSVKIVSNTKDSSKSDINGSKVLGLSNGCDVVYCKHCGKRIDEDSIFCYYCGERQ